MSFLDDDRLELDDPGEGAPRRERPTTRPNRGRGKGIGRPRPPQRRRASGGRDGGRPPRGGGGAAVLQQPLARLIIGLALVVVLIVIITLVVRDCNRSRLVDSYRSYLNDSGQVVNESSAQGKQLFVILSNPKRDNPPTVASKVRALAAEAQSLSNRAADLDPPGKLDAAQQSLATLLQYRVAGLRQLAANLPQAITSKDASYAAGLVADPMQTFLSSDVIYRNSFAGPATRALKDDDISGIAIADPASVRFLGNPNYAGPAGARALLPPLRRVGESSTGGLHGTGLVATVALPSNKQLSTSSTTTLTATDQLKWKVTVKNQGDFVENGIKVNATYSTPSAGPGESAPQQREIGSIEPGKEATVTIPGPPNPAPDEQASLKIEVLAVGGERNTTNNTAEYPVTLTLGG